MPHSLRRSVAVCVCVCVVCVCEAVSPRPRGDVSLRSLVRCGVCPHSEFRRKNHETKPSGQPNLKSSSNKV